MVEKVILENCEAHERTVLKLEQVTTIVGPNDVGKSAVLRALWWWAANDPAGTEHIRHGADTAAVHGKVDGEWVQRFRSPTDNSYTFRGETYTSLRAPAVPPTISDFLRIGEVNFQWQMDPPFWLVETPGQLSRKLNAVVDLVTIDEVLDVARGEVSKAKTKVELAETRVNDLKRKLAASEWVEAAEAALEEHEEQEEARDREHAIRTRLDTVIQQMAADDRTEIWLAGLERHLDATGRAAAEAVRDAADYFHLDKFVRELEAAERNLPPDIGPEWEDLLGLRRRGDEAAEYWRELDAHVRDHEHAEERACRLSEELQTLEERLKTETGGRCPACGKATESSEFLPPTSTSPMPSPPPEQRAVRSGFNRKKSSSRTTEE